MGGWVPVVDISYAQGHSVDFAKMRDAGVQGLVIRLIHGQTLDDVGVDNVRRARLAGFRDEDLAAYEFCNPKRGTAAQCAAAFHQAVLAAFGHDDVVMMLDVENYTGQSPNKGTALPAPAYAMWIDAHIGNLDTLTPAQKIFYGNASYWATGVGNVNAKLAGRLPWIGARYPLDTAAQYANHPMPGPAGWADWAFKLSSGPILPPGAQPWGGWQFSAEGNGQAGRYGCAGSDLDLDLVRVDAWAAWHGINAAPAPVEPEHPIVIPPESPNPPILEEDDMPAQRLYRKKSKLAVWLGDGRARAHVANSSSTNPDGLAKQAQLEAEYGPTLVLDDGQDLASVGKIVVGVNPGDV